MAFHHILVPVDFGPASARAIDLAVSIGSKFRAKLDLVHAFYIPPVAYGDGTISVPYVELMDAARTALDTVLARTKELYPSAEAVLVEGEPCQRVVETTARRGADLIVMGTYGARGLSHVLLGSVAELIVRTATVPVLTTKPAQAGRDEGTFRHVLAATDFGQPADHAISTAAQLAATFGAKLTVMHAYAIPETMYDERTYWPTARVLEEAEIGLERTLEKTRERLPHAESLLVRGNPSEAILDAAREQNADLVVMGTHGRTGLSRAILGSVAERVVRTSTIPVLTVGGRSGAESLSGR